MGVLGRTRRPRKACAPAGAADDENVRAIWRNQRRIGAVGRVIESMAACGARTGSPSRGEGGVVARARSEAVSERKRTVAVVDDDPRLLSRWRTCLKIGGYAAGIFPSAARCSMRGLSDWTSHHRHRHARHGRLRASRSREEGAAGLPVFLITGRHEIADQGRAQGINGFFRKPFDAESCWRPSGTLCAHREKEGSMKIDRANPGRRRPATQPGAYEQPLVMIVDDDDRFGKPCRS